MFATRGRSREGTGAPDRASEIASFRVRDRNTMTRIGAIDMGSNAIRFYVVETTGDSDYRILENLREPIRLGGDVFLTGNIREENLRRAETAFRRFRQILKQNGVQTVRAVATSATREAGNADLVLDRLEKASGIWPEAPSRSPWSRTAGSR